ncbi:hypothetical protein T492DRAFT_1107820 [Pavlovales sp. CCMP2436]|nr:hypothetical protein T492DRAFT_1107820 [Pavlovales sp. CCMP2436]
MREPARPHAGRALMGVVLAMLMHSPVPGHASALVPGAGEGCTDGTHLLCAFLRNAVWKGDKCCVQGERAGSTVQCVPGSHLACNYLGRATWAGLDCCVEASPALTCEHRCMDEPEWADESGRSCVDLEDAGVCHGGRLLHTVFPRFSSPPASPPPPRAPDEGAEMQATVAATGAGKRGGLRLFGAHEELPPIPAERACCVCGRNETREEEIAAASATPLFGGHSDARASADADEDADFGDGAGVAPWKGSGWGGKGGGWGGKGRGGLGPGHLGHGHSAQVPSLSEALARSEGRGREKERGLVRGHRAATAGGAGAHRAGALTDGPPGTRQELYRASHEGGAAEGSGARRLGEGEQGGQGGRLSAVVRGADLPSHDGAGRALGEKQGQHAQAPVRERMSGWGKETCMRKGTLWTGTHCCSDSFFDFHAEHCTEGTREACESGVEPSRWVPDLHKASGPVRAVETATSGVDAKTTFGRCCVKGSQWMQCVDATHLSCIFSGVWTGVRCCLDSPGPMTCVEGTAEDCRWLL